MVRAVGRTPRQRTTLYGGPSPERRAAARKTPADVPVPRPSRSAARAAPAEIIAAALQVRLLTN